MEQDTVQSELRLIRDHRYAVPDDTDAYPYTQIIMEEIGSTDADFRELIYEVLASWIANGVFRHKELRGLLLQALSPDYLLYGIGEDGTDSVFRRAASASVFGCYSIFFMNVIRFFIRGAARECCRANDRVSVFGTRCKRIYKRKKGKAQAVVQAADALSAIARCLTTEQASLAYAMLEAIKEKGVSGRASVCSFRR
ncbi:hypothetical protein GCM10020331_030180 [Ectobacillus funiculus]